jgi:hypothetical protein
LFGETLGRQQHRIAVITGAAFITVIAFIAIGAIGACADDSRLLNVR